MTLLSQEFYLQEDVVHLAKQLLGKWLMSSIDGKLTGGMIIETEAYKGAEDKACHAYQNRKTKRTEVMFEPGGHCYVYLCYGMHNLFNVVTANGGTPHAILIRALKADTGIDVMRKRRAKKTKLTSGPGSLCQALGIDRSHNGHLLLDSPIWIEDRGHTPQKIVSGPRVGIDYAEEHADLPWRFLVEEET